MTSTSDRTYDNDVAPTNGDAPETPTKLRKRSWFGVLRRTVREFKEDNLTDWAAALTYYGILSIFPALLAVVSVLGLIGVGDPALDPEFGLDRTGPREADSH